ncbi:hypothetical protein SUGI_0343240 [Cryptomeria japonica]|nr:hypothetical protein SUGI_0343240 [Cryptomeria japonica]
MLNLENNYLEGELPQQFGEMLSLQTLKLGGNRLNSYIPTSLANCKQLEILDLNNNKMRGIIPNWIGQLSSLKILILRSNRFEGLIPSELTTLPLLQILDLSSNRFSGIIPANLSSLQALKDQTVAAEIFLSGDIGTLKLYVDRVTINNKGQWMEFVRSLALAVGLRVCMDSKESERMKLVENIKDSSSTLVSGNLLDNDLQFQ